MTGIVDYGCGNLFSLESSLAKLDILCRISSDADFLYGCERIILPGVGAFGDAVKKLKERNLFNEIKRIAQQGMPLLGICVGMQTMFEKSYEFGEHEGLGLIRGEVKKIDTDLKIPHIGWNSLKIVSDSEILKYVKNGDYVYFVHSYAAVNCENVSATCVYGTDICAAVSKQNIYGVQFHPEKSGETGLKILKAFGELK